MSFSPQKLLEGEDVPCWRKCLLSFDSLGGQQNDTRSWTSHEIDWDNPVSVDRFTMGFSPTQAQWPRVFEARGQVQQGKEARGTPGFGHGVTHFGVVKRTIFSGISQLVQAGPFGELHPAEFNIAFEIWWLEDSFFRDICQMLNFRGVWQFCQICWVTAMKMMEPKDLSFWKASFSGFHVRFVGGNSC